MIRIGEIVKRDKNPLMVVSSNFEEIVKKLANFNYPSDEIKLLACLIISQTERQYKKYLIRVLHKLENLPVSKLIDDWQKENLEVDDNDFKDLLTEEEYKLFKNKGVEERLEEAEKKHPDLFNDGLNLAFYPTKKKGTVYLRRMIIKHSKNINSLNDFQRLILYFIAAQLLISWESSCVHLGMVILEDWNIKDMTKWFCRVWPIYRYPRATRGSLLS